MRLKGIAEKPNYKQYPVINITSETFKYTIIVLTFFMLITSLKLFVI